MITEIAPNSLELENQELRARLEVAEETLRAIRDDEVDAVVIETQRGDEVFTFKNLKQPYRMFIEQMREGAVYVATDGMIFYANGGFSDMMRCPLEKVFGSPLARFLRDEDSVALADLMKDTASGPGRREFLLQAADGSDVPACLSATRFEVDDVCGLCIVITDLTEHKER